MLVLMQLRVERLEKSIKLLKLCIKYTIKTWKGFDGWFRPVFIIPFVGV